MEKMNYHLSHELLKSNNLILIALKRSRYLLPLWLPYCLIKSIWILLTQKIDLIHLGDGLISPIGVILKIFFSVPVTITVHGKDVVWNFPLYQTIIPRSLGRLDHVICVSTRTEEECIKKGIKRDKISVINNGVDPFEYYLAEDKQNVKNKTKSLQGMRVDDKKILLSVGRFVERKGFHWFIENVLPEIILKSPDIIFLLVGDGPFHNEIKNAIQIAKLTDNVRLMGKMNQEDLISLYNASDLFVMPNIPVEGDVEGFGLVALEASSCGLYVVASNIEGVKDAVMTGQNGVLVPPLDVESFLETILTELDGDSLKRRSDIREFVIKNFSWNKVAGEYTKLFETLIA